MRIRWFFALLVLILFPAVSWTAEYTSQRNGDWSVVSTDPASPWYDNGAQTALAAVPGNGDTVTANHAVLCDVNTTVGDSPANQSSMSITITGLSGQLTLAEGITLTVRGNIYANSGTSKVNSRVGVLLNPGSQLVFDPSNVPAQSFYFKIGAWTIVQARGTLGNKSVIKTATGATRAKMMGEYGDAPAAFDLEHCDILNLSSMECNADFRYVVTSTFKNVKWSNCGPVKIQVFYAGTNLYLWDCWEEASTAIAGAQFYLNGKYGNTAGTQEVRRCVFLDNITFYPPSEWSVYDTYFHRGLATTLSVATTNRNQGFKNFQNIMYLSSSAGNLEGSMDRVYIVDDSTDANPRAVTWMNASGSYSMTNCVLDAISRSTVGDLVFPSGLTTGSTVTPQIKNNIALPSPTGLSFGKPWSLYWLMDKLNIAIENNTYYTYKDSAGETAVGVGELQGGETDGTVGVGYHVGEIESFKNNLAWFGGNPSNGGYKLVRQQSVMQDFVLAANADYNWGYNLSAGSEGNGYHCVNAATALFSAGTPDTHGGSGDPAFVDPTRNLATYDTQKLGNTAPAIAPNTVYGVGDIVSSQLSDWYGNAIINYRCKTAHTSAADLTSATNGRPGIPSSNWRTNWEVASKYRLRVDPTLISDLITWIKAGYTPTNMTLATAGEGGTYIGAVEPVAAGKKSIFQKIFKSKIFH